VLVLDLPRIRDRNICGGASKPPNMRDDYRELEKKSKTGKPGDHSMRVRIPRMLPALYDIRNNRGVGHVGGDVDSNLMDATAVYSMASWILAELVRAFHAVKTTDAQAAVDALVSGNCENACSTQS
jgi:hypothetical protein